MAQSLPDHPRLILSSNSQDVIGLSDQLAESMDKLLLEACNEMLELPAPERIIEGRRLLLVSRTYLKRISYLSYAWHITKNIKYAEKAESLMLAAADFTDWNPGHYLDVAEMTLALAIGYDWLYDELDSDSKKIISRAILEKGLMPSIKTRYGWLEGNNNWNQVCNTGMAFGAWAIYENEPETAEFIIQRTQKNILIPQAEYEPDGAYQEGASYWNYGTTFNALFIDAWESIYGKDIPGKGNGFQNTGNYFLHVNGPCGKFTYSDFWPESELSPAAFWFASKEGNPGLLYNQISEIKDFTDGNKTLNSKGAGNRLLPFSLLWFKELNVEGFPVPEELSWTGMGSNPISLHRTGWGENDIFIGIKGGSPNLPHAHMDIGSFVMDAMGERWAMDLGAHPYHQLESLGIDLWDRSQEGDRWKIFRYTNYAHNTLVVNGELQDVNARAEIYNIVENEQERGASVNMTSAYSNQLKKVTRTISILENSRVRLIDSLENENQKTKIRWAMLTPGEIRIIDDNRASISQNGKELLFQVKHPGKLKLTEYSSQPENDFEERNPGTGMIGFEISLKPGEKTVFEVLLIPVLE